MKSLTVGWLLLAAVPTHKMLLKTHSSVVRTIKRHLYYYSCSCWCGTNERIPLQCKQNCWVAWKIKFFDKIRKTWAQNYVFHTQHRCSFVLRFWLLMAIWPSTALAGCLLVHNWWAQCACCVTTEDKKADAARVLRSLPKLHSLDFFQAESRHSFKPLATQRTTKIEFICQLFCCSSLRRWSAPGAKWKFGLHQR